MLYLNGDRNIIVRSGDPRARFVLAHEGDEIPEAYSDLPIVGVDESEESYFAVEEPEEDFEVFEDED